jgi:hypothetical protein
MLKTNLTKIVVSVSVLALGVLLGASDCSGSNATPCESDTDCAALTATPTCDTVAKVCSADNTECLEDLDCELSTGAADQKACTACDAGDACVKDFEDKTYCAITPAAVAPCAAPLRSTSAEKADGSGAVDICLAPKTCTSGQCG